MWHSPRVLAGGRTPPTASALTTLSLHFRCHFLDHCRPKTLGKGDGKQMRSHCENASIFQGKVISHSGRVLYFRRSTKRKRLPEPNLCGRCGAAYLLDSSAGEVRMPVATRGEEFRPLCFEHHAEMKLGLDGRSRLFFCDIPGCTISYTTSRGYLFSLSAIQSEVQALPNVTCVLDGNPMYLAEVKPQNQSFRLWKCARCDRTHTNEDQIQPTK